tara:strand:- start:34265 stop:35473 length:1209 start_codon:yes stop_codon:yes gene_type:complete
MSNKIDLSKLDLKKLEELKNKVDSRMGQLQDNTNTLDIDFDELTDKEDIVGSILNADKSYTIFFDRTNFSDESENEKFDVSWDELQDFIKNVNGDSRYAYSRIDIGEKSSKGYKGRIAFIDNNCIVATDAGLFNELKDSFYHCKNLSYSSVVYGLKDGVITDLEYNSFDCTDQVLGSEVDNKYGYELHYKGEEIFSVEHQNEELNRTFPEGLSDQGTKAAGSLMNYFPSLIGAATPELIQKLKQLDFRFFPLDTRFQNRRILHQLLVADIDLFKRFGMLLYCRTTKKRELDVVQQMLTDKLTDEDVSEFLHTLVKHFEYSNNSDTKLWNLVSGLDNSYKGLVGSDLLRFVDFVYPNLVDRLLEQKVNLCQFSEVIVFLEGYLSVGEQIDSNMWQLLQLNIGD